MTDVAMLATMLALLSLATTMRVWLGSHERVNRARAEAQMQALAERRSPPPPRRVHANPTRPPGYRDPAMTVVHIATKRGPLCGPRDRFTAAVIGAPRSPTCEDCCAIASLVCDEYAAGHYGSPAIAEEAHSRGGGQ